MYLEEPILEIDYEADACYVRLRTDPVAFTSRCDGCELTGCDCSGYTDFSEDGWEVGLEFLNISKGIDLGWITNKESVELLTRMFTESGIKVK